MQKFLNVHLCTLENFIIFYYKRKGKIILKRKKVPVFSPKM
nr:MAG TPA: hypothetical protein [Caudoviricetes sp.]